MDLIHELGSLALGSRLKRISDRFMSEATQIYASQDVPFEPRWFPLFSLLARKDKIAVGQAAEALGVSHVAVSQTVQEMLKKGIITSTQDPSDKRRVVLSLSPKGKALLSKLNPLWVDINAAVDEVIRSTGVDLVATLARLERTLDTENLFARTQKKMRERQPDEVKIVDYRPALKDDFRKLNEEWITKFFQIEESDRKVFANPKKIIIDPGGYILFSTIKGKAVGTVALFKRGKGVFELGKMAVTPRAQGRHIGRRLMQAAIDRAKSKGARKIYLETSSILTPAINLYRSFGFVPVPSAHSEAYERVNLVMELKL